MASKGQVTEKDLENGLRSLGGLGSLGAAPSGARRDSPFGSEFAKRPTPVELRSRTAEAGNVALSLEPATEPVPPETANVAALPAAASAADAPGDLAKRRTPRRQKRPETKVDLVPERVTLLMSPEMRDRVNLLAAKLQRRKKNKTERITANTVLRVAVLSLLNTFKLEEGDAPNTEEELLELVQRKLRKT